MPLRSQCPSLRKSHRQMQDSVSVSDRITKAANAAFFVTVTVIHA